MAWYDTFAQFYDASLENLYRDARTEAVGHLGLSAGQTVVDLACGTGQNFPLLAAGVGPEGTIIGIDRSGGMLAAARQRVEYAGWTHVELRNADVADADVSGADALFCALGFSTFDDWEAVLDRCVAALPDGARIGIFDVLCERWNPQTTLVGWMAQADLYRELAQGLEARAVDFEHTWITGSPWVFGGRLFVATGTVRHQNRTNSSQV